MGYTVGSEIGFVVGCMLDISPIMDVGIWLGLWLNVMPLGLGVARFSTPVGLSLGQLVGELVGCSGALLGISL